jgi:hemoglobin-like flavoprotein
MTLDIASLESSFDLVAERGDELVSHFYERLFVTRPAVRPLFASTDLRRQRAMLVLLRKKLRDLDAVVPKLRELGACHVRYGAHPLTTPSSPTC